MPKKTTRPALLEIVQPVAAANIRGQAHPGADWSLLAAWLLSGLPGLQSPDWRFQDIAFLASRVRSGRTRFQFEA